MALPDLTRRTKIVATIGPATESPEQLRRLIEAGATTFRLNFSHGTHQSHGATYSRVRAAAKRAKRDVAILQDLGGPKIRTGPVTDGRPVTLTAGNTLRIATGEFPGTAERI